MKIEIVKCLSDNFSYLLINEKNLDACVVDPGEAKPVLECIYKNNLNLKYILNTHHHGDHIGGNNILKNEFNAKILAFENDKDRIPSIDIFLKDNQVWKDGIFEFKVMHVPGHTSGHICFYFFNEKTVFTGDTLFSLGCGRIFEGTHKEMFDSLVKLKNLPPETKVYCGHEYTKSNLEFCLKYDPKNSLLKDKSLKLDSILKKNLPSIPTTIEDEIKMNIFFRFDNAYIKEGLNLEDSSDQEIFSKLRDLKDTF